MCSIDDVAGWGPFAQNAASCGHLSFTLLFEEALMSMLPAVLSLLLAVYRVSVLAKANVKVERSGIRIVKLVLLASFAILACTQVGLYAVHGTPRTKLSLASAVILLLAALSFIPLSVLEHSRSLRPSAILQLYFGLSLPLGIIQCRTLWTIQHSKPVAVAFTVMLILRLLILLAESQDKRHILLPAHRHLSPECTDGFFSILTLSWLLPMMKRGFTSSLSPQSLFYLQPDMSSKSLLDSIASHWNNTDQGKTFALFYTLIGQQKYTVFAGVFFRLCLTALWFSQPFLVQAELQLTSHRQSASAARGTWLLVGYAVVYIGIAICQAGYQYHTRRFIVQVRGSLVSLLYRHVLAADVTKGSESVPIALMSVDMEKMASGLISAHQAWASLIEIGLFVWVLQRQLHLAIVASTFASIACLVAGGLISVQAGGHLTSWLEATQRRVEMTESVLSRFKPIALAGFLDAVKSRISGLRDSEVQISKRYRASIVGMLTISYLSMVIAPVIGFGLFAFYPSIRGSHVFNAEVAFSSLTAFALFSKSIASFVQSMFDLMSALSGFERYRKTLLEAQRTDPRLDKDECPLPPALASSITGIKEDVAGVVLQILSPSQPQPKPDSTCVVLRGADIGWPGKPDLISKASFSIRNQKITAITGGPSSGKTTLLEALMGEAKVSQGTLSTNFTHAAYCSQTPWIHDGTIRDNVIGCANLNVTRYKTVMEACGLLQDLDRMPLKDMTHVGSGGSLLSGGQRKRVGLARAVYSRLEVLILDDVLSGLDPETSNNVWQNLCGLNGLLRREGRTVIFSSMHDPALILADDIFDIVNGTISQRPPQDVRQDNRTSFDTSGLDLNVTSFLDTHLGSNTPSMVREAESTTDFSEESESLKKNKRLGEWEAYRFYTAAIGRRNTLVLVLLCLSVVMGLQLPQIWIGLWTRSRERQDGLSSGAYYGVYVMFGVIALFSLLAGGLYLMLIMVPRSARVLHRALLDATFKASIVFINNQSIGSILNRFTQDLAIIDTEVPIASFNTVFFVVTCLVQIVFICISSRYMATLVLVILAMFYVIQKFYLRTSRQLRILDIEAKAPLISHFSDTIAGLKTIRGGGWTAQFEESALEILDSSQRAFYLLYCVQVWLGLALDLLVAAVAIILVAITNDSRGSATSGFLGVAVTSLVNFGVNANDLIVSWTYVETAVQAVLRIRDYSRNTPVEDASDQTPASAIDWPEEGSIEFRNVCASYGKDASLALDNLSFAIKPGQRIGVCGRSGSGKSSLLATLYRLLETDSGSILIGGVDIRQLTRQRLRSRLLNVPQDPFLVPGTWRYNLDPWNTKSDAELIAALEAVKLWGLLKKDGLDSDVGKHVLSSGQMQCISLARALVREGNIVIVDELTSNMDPQSAATMRTVLREHFRSHTVIMVTHRLDDLLECDQVLVLEEGRLVELDSPRALLANKGSKFRKIFTFY